MPLKNLLVLTGLAVSTLIVEVKAQTSPQDEALKSELKNPELRKIAQDLSWERTEPWEKNLDAREQEREWERQSRVQELWELEQED